MKPIDAVEPIKPNVKIMNLKIVLLSEEREGQTKTEIKREIRMNVKLKLIFSLDICVDRMRRRRRRLIART